MNETKKTKNQLIFERVKDLKLTYLPEIAYQMAAEEFYLSSHRIRSIYFQMKKNKLQ